MPSVANVDSKSKTMSLVEAAEIKDSLGTYMALLFAKCWVSTPELFLGTMKVTI